MYGRITSADSHVAETEVWDEDIDPKFHARMITHDHVAALYGIAA